MSGINPDEIYEDDCIDVTERVECYENGKAFECDCGQGIGIGLDRPTVRCASCGSLCLDTKSGEREREETKTIQESLGEWT